MGSIPIARTMNREAQKIWDSFWDKVKNGPYKVTEVDENITEIHSYKNKAKTMVYRSAFLDLSSYHGLEGAKEYLNMTLRMLEMTPGDFVELAKEKMK